MKSTEEYYPVLKYFKYGHLKGALQERSKEFCELAHTMANEAIEQDHDPREVSAGLRKLMEAKDCFVRAMIK